jgi:hypothetical protein
VEVPGVLAGIHADFSIDLLDILGRHGQWQGYSEGEGGDEKTHETSSRWGYRL